MHRSSINDNHQMLTDSTSNARNYSSMLLLSPQPLMPKRNRSKNDSDIEDSTKEISKNSLSKRLALVFEKQRKLSSAQIAPFSPSTKKNVIIVRQGRFAFFFFVVATETTTTKIQQWCRRRSYCPKR